MGWKTTGFLFLFALWALNVGALIIGIPILLYLLFSFWSNRRAKPNGTGRSHWMVYLGAFVLFLSMIAAAEHGTHSPPVFGTVGIALLVFGLFPGIVQEFWERVAGPASELFRQLSGKDEGAVKPLACVELTQLPLDYLDQKENDPKETLLKFQRLSQTLAELDSPVELRLEFFEGSGSIMFLVPTGEDDDSVQELLWTVKSQLPEFGAKIIERPTMDNLCSVVVEGVPELSVDPVGPLARFFIENRLNGCYSVSTSPAWVNPLSRWFAGHSQKRIAESTGYQHVDEDRTTTVVDHPKQVELEESVKGLERLTSKRPIRVTVQISAEDEATAYNAANVLAGALSSHRRINGLKVRRLSSPTRSGWRRSTLMLPSEAAPYFWLPQVPIGIKMAPSAEFHAPPVSDGDLLLGEVVSLSGKSGRKVKIERDQLAKHVFITGMTGSGKTTSTFSLLIQLHRLGVPFLVIEPVKSEYRSLLTCVPDLQVFTIGDEATAPFRLNIFEPPPGVKVQTHLENLEAVWNASFVSYAPLPYVVKQVFAETYRACGWYLSEDVHGRAITFDDVQVQIEKVAKELGYERDVTMDIEAALKTRLRSLTLGGKGPLFGALSSTPLDEVLKRPTVVELKEIQNDEEKAFVAAMILMNLASFVQAKGHSKKLRHFTLIEEAHRLLPNVSTEKGDPESADPRRRMVEQFGEMLSEARAYGEGLGIVEQIPTKILPDSIKNTATKVIHRVPAEDDRRILAGAINATYEQAALFTALKSGEAVVSMESHPVPFRVEVENVISKLGVPVGEVSDEEVRTRMAGFYVKNPVPRKAPKSADGRLADLVGSEAFREPFLEAYHAWWADGQVVPLRDLLALTAPKYAAKKQELVNAASNILTLAIESYTTLDEEDRILFSRAFMKAVGRSIGDARGLR